MNVLGQFVGGQALAAAQPLLHPEHLPDLGAVHQPVLRPEVAVHRAVHDLHHRHRLRKDDVAGAPYDLANPWAFPWQSKYKGKVAILDDYPGAWPSG